MIVKTGSTDVTTYFVLRDSTAHAPKTDVTITDIDIYYVTDRAAISAKADLTALAAADSAHSDNKGYHVGQGVYRIDWPDAAFAGGVGTKVQLIVVCTGVDTTFLEVTMSPAVDTTSVSGTSQTARDLGASVLLSSGTGTGQISLSSGTVTVGTNNDKTGYTASTVSDKTGYSLLATTGLGNQTANITGNLSGSVGSVTGAVGSVTARVTANADQFAGDATAATNAALQFNGTGLTGSTYPSRQDQLDNIVATGAAVNQSAESFTLATGSQTGTYANTAARDGVIHQLNDTAGTLDGYYQFDIGQTGIPASVQFYIANVGTNDTIGFYGYNWGTTSWVQIGSKTGTAGITYSSQVFPMYVSMVGTGANLGKVRIRVYGTGLTSSITYVDQVFVSYAIVNQSVGYSQGAIWIDSTNGTAGTTPYVNGTADKPVPTWANALTLAAAMTIYRFNIAPGTQITATADCKKYALAGKGWKLALGGYDFSYATIDGCEYVTGTALAADWETFFWNCQFGAVTLGEADLHNCHITDVVTLGATAPYLFNKCVGVPIGTSGIDFGSAVGASSVVCGQCAGVWTIANMKSGDVLYFDGNADVTLAASCIGGTVYISGGIRLTNNGSGQTIYDTSRYGEEQNVTNVTGSVTGAVGSVTAEVSANVTKINSVATSSVTTVNANIGTTQPTNYSGTGSSALVKTDLIDIGGQAISGNNATLNLKQLNIVNSTGTAIIAQSTGSNGNGAFIAGNGSGTALSILADTTGMGVVVTSPNNHAIVAEAGGNGNAFYGIGSGTGDGMRLDAGGGTGSKDLKADNIPDYVLDEPLSGHLTAGTVGKGISDAALAGDQWTTALPGSYTAGQAGYILGTNLNATVSSRSSHSAADIWSVGTRTLTSFGTLVSDIWASATRTLTSFGTLAADVWASATRTITGGTITTNSDKTGYTVSTVSDKSGYSLTSDYDAAKTAAQVADVPTTAEIDAALSLAHGSGEWGTGVPGTFLVNITVYDEHSAPVPDVSIRVTDESGLTTYNTAHTSSSGIATLSLDNGTYHVILRKYFYNFTVPEELVVSGDTNVVYTCETITPTTTDNGQQVLIIVPEDSGFVYDENATILGKLVNMNNFSGDLSIVRDTVTATNNGSYYEMVVVKGIEYHILGTSSDRTFLNMVITITDDNVKNISTYSV